LRAQLYHRGLPEAKAIADYQLPIVRGHRFRPEAVGLRDRGRLARTRAQREEVFGHRYPQMHESETINGFQIKNKLRLSLGSLKIRAYLWLMFYSRFAPH
jgi:hypothetical protein